MGYTRPTSTTGNLEGTGDIPYTIAVSHPDYEDPSPFHSSLTVTEPVEKSWYQENKNPLIVMALIASVFVIIAVGGKIK